MQPTDDDGGTGGEKLLGDFDAFLSLLVSQFQCTVFMFTESVHQSYRLEIVLVDALVTQRLEVIPVKCRFAGSWAAAEDN